MEARRSFAQSMSAMLKLAVVGVLLVSCGGADDPAGESAAEVMPTVVVATEVPVAPTATPGPQPTATTAPVEPTQEPAQVPTDEPAQEAVAGPASSIATPDFVELAEGGNGVAVPLATAPLPSGWSEDEYVFGGTATGFESTDASLSEEGSWSVAPATTTPYKTRLIVRRPPASDFSGNIIVEWFNVTAGIDTSPDWGYLAEEIERSGHVWVGVSVQSVGVNGLPGEGRVGGLVDTRGLKAIDPERYGSLVHPGDVFAFDIMTQAGAIMAGLHEVDVLDGLVADRVLAFGESQSAAFLTTYVNAVHPVTGLFDGFFIHSRGAGAPHPFPDEQSDRVGVVRIREDIGVPVFQYEAETDLTALGFVAARQLDSEWVHTWEVAGTAHADAYSLSIMGGLPRDANMGTAIGCEVPINDGPHHETLQAALDHFVRWVSAGVTPPASPLVAIDASDPENPVVERDDLGVALGGIRTPPVDLPLRVLSGDPSGEPEGFCFLFGQTLALESDQLAELHGDVDSYVAALTAAADTAVDDGWLLAADAATLVAEETARAEALFG